MGSLWCTLYWFFVCYLYLIQLADLSMCEGTDTMKIRVSDQSGAMLYFPPDKSAEVFTSHPGIVVTARQDGSSPTHCNDRQLTLTIIPLLLMLTRAHPFSLHWEGMQREIEGKMEERREERWEKRGRLTGIQARKKDQFLSSRQSATTMVILQQHPSSAV